MKHFFLLLILLVFATNLSAQIQKGTVLLGGTVGFNRISEDGEGITYVNLSPNAGFFLTDRFALGSSLDFIVVASDGESSTSFGLSPFARYYLNEGGKSRFFGQGKFGFQIGDTDFFDESTAWIFGLGIGADFFLNDNVAIEAILGYERLQYPEYELGLNHIGLNFGVAAFISRGKKE
ncbi:MAG: outer membrane beta-barrel protein [Lewinellaceae bacterium]|nr:outer membrane beta-barrel protein [Lewinellaceae bacterium]